MLANFGLTINGHQTPTTKTNILTFVENKRLFSCENNLHQITKSYLWTKNKGNRFFNFCYSMVDIS